MIKRSQPKGLKRLPRPWRVVIWLAIGLGYAAIMWFFVFPWLDRTFVNQPTL